MPRAQRVIIPDLPHHITQRGNYRQQVFYREADRTLYLQLLKEYSRHYGVAIQAYCLMRNHVHLIATPHDRKGLSRLLQRLHSEYARNLHCRLRRVGHLWQARYGSVAMDEEHLWAAMVYVEQNPPRAGLVSDSWDWKWSSARAHLSDDDQGWLDLLQWRKQFQPESWKRCLTLGLADAMLVERIREGTRFGWPLGSDSFLDEIEQLHGLRTRRSRPGRKPAQRSDSVSMVSASSGASAASQFGS
jgi:putative transposase